MKRISLILVGVCIAALILLKTACGAGIVTPRPVVNGKPVESIYELTVKDITGTEVPLSRYKGKVVMIVNTASKCGFTKQYAGLQTLYDVYKEQGFVILGFPANNFFGQEPGTNEEIQTFCSTEFGVTFPMFAKISVKGKDQAPLYRFLTGKDTNPEFAGNISWNFNKFLISRDGRIINRFGTRTKPEDERVITAVEEALKDEGTRGTQTGTGGTGLPAPKAE